MSDISPKASEKASNVTHEAAKQKPTDRHDKGQDDGHDGGVRSSNSPSALHADFTEHVTGLSLPDPWSNQAKGSALAPSNRSTWDQWPGPILEGDWQDLTPEQLKLTLLKWLAKEDPVHPRSHGYRFHQARRLPLPFYPGGSLIEIAAEDSQDSGLLTLIETPGELTQMRGQSAALHALNAKLRLKLNTADLAAHYLQLFCALVHGEQGAFNVVQTPAQIMALLQAPHPTCMSTVKLMKFIDQDRDQKGATCFTFEATIKYANALFLATMEVQEGGMVTMLNDAPCCADLPALCDKFHGDLRVRHAWVADSDA